MYPSIKFGMIEKTVYYFLRDVSDADKESANRCLELVKLGMAHTFITFEDTY